MNSRRERDCPIYHLPVTLLPFTIDRFPSTIELCSTPHRRLSRSPQLDQYSQSIASEPLSR
jgi:hypothetical protein